MNTSGIADTPVELSTRLREANDSWVAIKRRLKGDDRARGERRWSALSKKQSKGNTSKTTLASRSRSSERPRARRRQHASGSASLLEERLPVRAVVVAVGPIV